MDPLPSRFDRRAPLQRSDSLTSTDEVSGTCNVTGSAYVDHITTQPWELDADGMLPVPEGPGLGIALDTDSLARYTDTDTLLRP
jgi:D-galactarolactone cycloisomerase